MSRTFQTFVLISTGDDYAVKRKRMTVLFSFQPKLSKVLPEVPAAIGCVQFKDTDSVAPKLYFGMFNKT